jgi:sugar fermentation stimulation protein A
MKIKNLKKVKYKSRPNRFTVEFIDDDNSIQLAHLHDPGRLKELLIENRDILVEYVEDYKKTNRKTAYNMIAIFHEDNWVLLNSSFHNSLVKELIAEKKIDQLQKYDVKQAEYTYGNSRLDFLLCDDTNNELYLEVKGCTLVVDQTAKFPDAPTTRGKKHVDELIKIKEENNDSAIIILILQNNAKIFTPNYDTDFAFSKSLEEAYAKNVKIYPVHILTEYSDNTLTLKYGGQLKLKFNPQ